ncbi:unnamed protein product [Brassicogethes aeneus]|uniref:Envelope protein n=1 Tax=Brassicogethes aeneus TaxID=1431903 RepID=A0A9P0FG14_BRAAE|nr:unnamed protein product [Brassicogethes aeneus]
MTEPKNFHINAIPVFNGDQSTLALFISASESFIDTFTNKENPRDVKNEWILRLIVSKLEDELENLLSDLDAPRELNTPPPEQVEQNLRPPPATAELTETLEEIFEPIPQNQNEDTLSDSIHFNENVEPRNGIPISDDAIESKPNQYFITPVSMNPRKVKHIKIGKQNKFFVQISRNNNEQEIIEFLKNYTAKTQELFNELVTVTELPQNPQLPYKVNSDTINIYERIAVVKSYIKNEKIYFIIEIPIVEKLPYSYFHLYSIPVKTIHSYNIIIPQTKYLALNEKFYTLSNERCKQVANMEFLCNAQQSHKISQNSPCEVQLLQFTNSYKKCAQKQVEIQNPKFEKLKENRWLIILPNETVITSECPTSKEKISLIGNFVMEIPETCQVHIEEKILKTYQNPVKNTEIIKIPNIEIPVLQKPVNSRQKPLKLETVQLDEIHPLIKQLENTEEMIRENNIPNFNEKPNLWTIFLYAIIAFGLAIIIFKHRSKLTPKKKTSTPEKEPEEEEIQLRNFRKP